MGYSASGIYPYLAHECVADLCARGELSLAPEEACAAYDRAVTAGIVSIMSKMGISTMQGYHSAQIFEILGLSDELVEKYFTFTATTRVGGLTVADLQRELDARAAAARAQAASPAPDQLPTLGLTKWRPGGEEHLIDPKAIYLLQRACREGDYGLFKEFSSWVHRGGRAVTLRDLMDFSPAGAPVPLDEVEPASEIVKRFNTGAMSYGSISREQHECLAIAMNRLHGRSNTGEGGEDPARETALPGGDSACSAIKQVASGRFGVTSRYLSSAIEIQIKMAQGAKPGEGGHLPGRKVYPWIAEVRQSTPGVGLISPPPHHDIYSIEDLAELIFDLKNANPGARISVKLCALAGVGTIATGVAKGGADKILVSGHNGGTGAAPRDSIYHAGIPFEIGLAETQQTLLRNGLRSRVVLETDGKLMSGRDVAIAALLGAEEFGFATMPLIACGCLMQRDCQRDTCPAGVATQDCRLRARFAGRPEHVVNYLTFVAEELREVMASLGFRTVDEMVGRAGLPAPGAGRRGGQLEGQPPGPLRPSRLPPSLSSAGTSPARTAATSCPRWARTWSSTARSTPRSSCPTRPRPARTSRRCASARTSTTSTAAWARSWAATSRGRTRRACPRARSRWTARARPARASARSCRRASRSTSPATPTTTLARGSRAACCPCARPTAPPTSSTRTSSWATWPSTAPRAAGAL